MEKYTSLKGIQSLYSHYSNIPINTLQDNAIYASEIFLRALENEQAALLTYQDLTKYIIIHPLCASQFDRKFMGF